MVWLLNFSNKMKFKCILHYNNHGLEHTLIILIPTAY